jgi:hypothetical protein
MENAPVTVARHPGGDGELEQDVEYRLDGHAATAGTALPVRYELVVDAVP